MSTAIAGIHSHSSIGTCPHGMSPGACPICSGMGGGGSKVTNTVKASEMSWSECAAIGAMIRAQKLAQTQAQVQTQNNLIAIAKFQQNMTNLAKQMTAFTQSIANMPPVIAKPVSFIMNKVMIPLVNAMKDLPMNAAKLVAKLADISDKLNAMFGELKNATEKKISEKMKSFKKKLKSLFAIFEPLDIEDDDKKIEEEKRIFELRTFIHDLYNKLNNEEEIYDER